MPKKDFLQHTVFGGTAGLTATLFTHPLDLLQTRLQSSIKLHNVEVVHKSMFLTKCVHGLKSIAENEGFRGLFRGIIPSLTAIVPGRAIFFGVYGYSRKLIISKNILSESNPLIELICSSCGMFASTVAMNPIFLLKTRIQLQEQFIRSSVNNITKGKISNSNTNTVYKGYLDCIKKVYRHEGFFAFYRGITASWLGISETALYFIIYEKMKRYFGLTSKLRNRNEKFPAHMIIGITIICKMIASIATYPHELIRTRMRERAMTEHPKLIATTMQILREEGFLKLYGGMGVHLVRVVPNAIIVFLVYEFLKKKFVTNKN